VYVGSAVLVCVALRVGTGVLVRDGNGVRVECAVAVGVEVRTDVGVDVEVGGSVPPAAVTCVGVLYKGAIRVAGGVLVRVDAWTCEGKGVAVCGGNIGVDAWSGTFVGSGLSGSVSRWVGRGKAVEGIAGTADVGREVEMMCGAAVATGCTGLLFSGALTGGRAVFAATATGVFAWRDGGSTGLRV
jgi:hypothetical protein